MAPATSLKQDVPSDKALVHDAPPQTVRKIQQTPPVNRVGNEDGNNYEDGDEDSSVVSSSSSDTTDSVDSEASEVNGETEAEHPHHGSHIKVQSRADLKSRLAAFLPQLKAANEGLGERDAGGFEIVEGEGDEEGRKGQGKENTRNMKHEEEDGPYIEMDLGCGVLEERRDHGESSDEEPDKEGLADEDIMARLMGRREEDAAEGKAHIEEV